MTSDGNLRDKESVNPCLTSNCATHLKIGISKVFFSHRIIEDVEKYESPFKNAVIRVSLDGDGFSGVSS